MEIIRQLLAVVLVFAFLWTARWLLRKRAWRAKSAPALLESRGKLALTPRHSIHLIRIGDRDLIVALHPDGVTFLGDGTPAMDGRTKNHAATDSAAIGSAAI
jgi:flagellar biogenesis protein FliO